MSTAQIHFRIGIALAVSACLHAAMVTTACLKMALPKQETAGPMLRVVLSATRISPPLKRGVGGFTKKQSRKNPSSSMSSTQDGPNPPNPLFQKGNNTPQGVAPRDIVKPEYTARALRLGIEGEVVLSVTVGPDGRVVSAQVAKGLGYGLDEAALDAIRQSTFFPAQHAEGAVSEQIIYRFRFEITT